MSKYNVRVIDEVEFDIQDIYDYIARHDAVEKAEYVLGKLESLIYSLENSPTRGHIPPEMQKIGNRQFKEVHFKPYRVVYQIIGKEVVILLCVDGRRDMQSLLQRRLTR